MPPWWTAVLDSCLRRIRTWCVPSNCSRLDWMEEMRAQAEAAAWQALCDFDPARGVPLTAFVRQRVLASALTRYRQEWAFALRCLPEAEVDPPFSEPLEGLLRQALAWLPECDRRLIQRLFWEGDTEAAVAEGLGISQRAVSKRKRAILQALHGQLEAGEKKRGN